MPNYYNYPYNNYVPQQNNNSGLLWVQGVSGAKSYLVAPGNTVLLMDSESSQFYLKSADTSGMPTMRTFKYEEVKDVQGAIEPSNDKGADYPTREEFDDLKALYDTLKAKIDDINKPVKEKKKDDK